MTCSAPHLSFSYLHVSYNIHFLTPSGGAPAGRNAGSPEDTQPSQMLTAMLNNLDYTQGNRQNPVSREIFWRPVPLWVRDAPLHVSNRAFRHLIPLLRRLEKEGLRGLVEWPRKEEACPRRALSPSSTARAEATTPGPPVWRPRSSGSSAFPQSWSAAVVESSKSPMATT